MRPHFSNNVSTCNTRSALPYSVKDNRLTNDTILVNKKLGSLGQTYEVGFSDVYKAKKPQVKQCLRRLAKRQYKLYT
jgi:hypothetical protein